MRPCLQCAREKISCRVIKTSCPAWGRETQQLHEQEAERSAQLETAGGLRALLGLTLREQTGVAPSSPRSRPQMVAVLLVLASLFAVATGQAGCPTQSKVRLVFCYASAFLLREPTRARRCLVPRVC